MLPDLGLALQRGLENQPDDRDNTVLHVTDLSATLPGEGCPRQLWLRIHGAKQKPLTFGQLLMFDHGHRIHERIVELLDKGLEGWRIGGIEKAVEYDGVVGRVDAILTTEHDHVVIDFKTVRGRKFRYLNKTNEPQAGHVLQVQTYMYLLDNAKIIDADCGMVLYVDREGQNQVKQFQVLRDDPAVIAAILEARNIIAAPEPPDILSPKLEIKENKGDNSVKLKQGWVCSYCQYQDVSCKGALPYELRDLGIIGHLGGDGFKPKIELTVDTLSMVNELLRLTNVR